MFVPIHIAGTHADEKLSIIPIPNEGHSHPEWRGDKIMTYAPRPSEFIPYQEVLPVQASRAKAARPGLWRRFVGAVFESRERYVERAAERYIARSGGRLTDEIERQIADHLITGKWWQ
jgi:hypothetical protein